MNIEISISTSSSVSAGCHINDVMNVFQSCFIQVSVSAGCHINDVMNRGDKQ